MAAPLKQSTIVPDLPRDTQLVNEKGEITAHWKLYFEQLNQALQTNLKAEGTVFPQQDMTNIGLLTAQQSLGNILYDSTNNIFKGNVLTAPNTYTWKTFLMI